MNESDSLEQFPAHGGLVFETARRLGVEPEDILDFSANLNPLGPPPGLYRYLTGRMNRTLHYPDPYCDALKDSLSHFHELEPGHVVIGNGSTQLIYAIPRVLRPRRALIIDPAFGEYERAVELADGAALESCTLTPEQQFVPTGPQTREWLESGADMIFIGNPSNPAGALIPLEVLEPFIKLAAERNIYVILDEAFIDFAPEASAMNLRKLPETTIVLRSFTKIYALPGLRLGYLIAAPRIARRIELALEPWSVNVLAEAAGQYCLRNGDYVSESVGYVDSERTWLEKRLNALNAFELFPSRANYILVRCVEPRLNAGVLQASLLDDRILIRNCASYRGLSNKYVRLAVRKRDENKTLLASLERTIRSL